MGSDSEEMLAKRFKSSSLDEVLEIFSTYSDPAPNYSRAKVIKQEVDEEAASPVKFSDRYSHILVKETMVVEDDGIKALVGDSFVKQGEVANDTTKDLRVAKMSEVLRELEHLKRQLHYRFSEKEKECRNLKELYEDLKSKSDPDADFENEVKTVIKMKQQKIVELEKALEESRKENEHDSGDNELLLINIRLKKDLEEKNSEIKVMEERVNHVKELVSVSYGRVKEVKEKEEHFKNLKLENEHLRERVEILAEELKERDVKIDILKETNANLEQEVSLTIETSRDMDDDTAEDALEDKNEEIFHLKDKVESLTSQNSSLQNMRTENNHLESLLKQREEEIEVLKENQTDRNNIKKYEAILIEKDKELFSLKEQNSNGALNDLKTEYKMYFNELEQKAQQFLNLIKDQQEEINTLKKQKVVGPIKPVQTQAPTTPARFLRPVKSQVPFSASAKARLGNLSDINVQRMQESPPPHLSIPSPNLLPDLVSSSKSGVAQYDQAPRYYQGQLPPLSLSSTFGPSQTLQPTRTHLQSTQPFQPAPPLQPPQSFLSYPGDIPVLQGPFNFD